MGSVKKLYIRLRGLPWNTTVENIEEFFQVELKEEDVHIIKTPDGRDSGEAVIRVASEKEKVPMMAKHKQYMGRRYVEIFDASKGEWDRVTGSGTKVTSTRHENSEVLLLRGLPYSATEDDIRSFFGDSIEILSVHLTKDHLGRASGQGFVELKTKEDIQKALKKDKDYIKNRYIELFESSQGDLDKALRPTQNYYRFNQYQNKPMGGKNHYAHGMFNDQKEPTFCLRMRGLPYNTSEDDIMDFFQEAHVVPARIHKKADGSEAYVEFRTREEKEKGLKKNKCFIGSRYVELIDCKYEEIARRVGIVQPQAYYFYPQNMGSHSHTPRPYYGYPNHVFGSY